jgi:hypothetical protein
MYLSVEGVMGYGKSNKHSEQQGSIARHHNSQDANYECDDTMSPAIGDDIFSSQEADERDIANEDSNEEPTPTLLISGQAQTTRWDKYHILENSNVSGEVRCDDDDNSKPLVLELVDTVPTEEESHVDSSPSLVKEGESLQTTKGIFIQKLV